MSEYCGKTIRPLLVYGEVGDKTLVDKRYNLLFSKLNSGGNIGEWIDILEPKKFSVRKCKIKVCREWLDKYFRDNFSTDEIEVDIIFVKGFCVEEEYHSLKHFDHENDPMLAYLSGMHKGCFIN